MQRSVMISRIFIAMEDLVQIVFYFRICNVKMATYIQKISNVRISIPRSELESGEMTIHDGSHHHLQLDTRKLDLSKTDFSGDSESETERIVFNENPVAKFIEVDGVGKDENEEMFARELDEFGSSKVRPFECNICHKMFTRVEILRRHLKTHMIEKDYKCTYCGKTFDRRDVLNDHMRNHTGEKPFQCTICHKKFTRGFVLLRHMRIHNEGGFKCKFCLKTFDRKDTFRDHVRNHTGEKPFKCRYCNKSFSRSFVLTKHEKGHEMKVEGMEEESDLHKTETILVESLEYEDKDVSDATEMLLQKEFQHVSEDVIEESAVEQEIIEDDEDFSFPQSHDLHSDTLVNEAVNEEVVETEAITLATADGQIVRVISREQYEKLVEVANKSKTYRCETCNRTFTNHNIYQAHFSEPWENGGCISQK
ncbi:zinc finger protein 90 [Eurytemora carolleeae]|uniref:zinc finger protein 90 n=1 Tax=Eurytemora carolleeae TaxID=1294199 RepID=UPI000C780DEA|nr:zinc finger protein 90 [Eurytemora carolleeae]|eukprot:XP_023338084.1 zinc finger protein 90-like [Eurytemora affinis]